MNHEVKSRMSSCRLNFVHQLLPAVWRVWHEGYSNTGHKSWQGHNKAIVLRFKDEYNFLTRKGWPYDSASWPVITGKEAMTMGDKEYCDAKVLRLKALWKSTPAGRQTFRGGFDFPSFVVDELNGRADNIAQAWERMGQSNQTEFMGS